MAKTGFAIDTSAALKRRTEWPMVAAVGPDDHRFVMALSRVLSARKQSERKTTVKSHFSNPAHPVFEPCTAFQSAGRRFVLYDAGKFISYYRKTHPDFATRFLQPVGATSAVLAVFDGVTPPLGLSTFRFAGVRQAIVFLDRRADRSAALRSLQSAGFEGTAAVFSGELSAMIKCRCTEAACPRCDPMLALCAAISESVKPRPATEPLLMYVEKGSPYGMAGEYAVYGAVLRGAVARGSRVLAIDAGVHSAVVQDGLKGKWGEDGALLKLPPGAGRVVALAADGTSPEVLSRLRALADQKGLFAETT